MVVCLKPLPHGVFKCHRSSSGSRSLSGLKRVTSLDEVQRGVYATKAQLSDASLCIGVDVGTQSTKVLVYQPSTNEVLGRGAFEYGLMLSDVSARAEQEPSTWEEGMEVAIKTAMEGLDPDNVHAMAVSGQQHGLVAVDSDGKVIRPAKLWCDTESAPQAAELAKQLGWDIQPGFTATKLLWLKQNEPENFAKMEKVMLPHDYINFKLTGRYAMEAGDASGIGVMDMGTKQFDPALCKLVDPRLHSILPPLVSPDAPFGKLLPEAAQRYNLSAGTLVAAGSGDNMMSALGAGAVEEGVLVVSLGTSGTLFGLSSKPLVDNTGTIAPFCDATGSWLPLVCTQNCTNVPEDIRRSFDLSRDDITELASKELPGCDGVNYLPYLSGARTPNWPHASGTLLGLKAGSMRPGLLYRAAMEGVTFSLYGGYLAMKERGLTATELRVVGGGSKNKLWRQIIADVFQVSLRFPQEPESAALGAALQAAAVLSQARVAEFIQAAKPPMSDDVVMPNPENAEVYAKAFQQHVELGRTLFDRKQDPSKVQSGGSKAVSSST